MNWKIKAIVNEQGEDLYLGDVVLLGEKEEEVISINLINGMLIINGQVIDVQQMATTVNEQEITDPVTFPDETEVTVDSIAELIKEANEEET